MHGLVDAEMPSEAQRERQPIYEICAIFTLLSSNSAAMMRLEEKHYGSAI